MVASLLGPFLFLSSPESNGAENSTALLALTFFLLFGSGGVVLCRRLTAGLPETELKDPNVGRVTAGTRWLAIATGLVVAVTGWSGLGLYSAIFPSIWVAGAITQPRFQRYGFWLMLVPAVYVTSWMLPLGCFLLFESVRVPNWYHDPKIILLSSFWTGSLSLLTCYDAALINEGFKMKLFLKS
jgi:hypothetical protein